MPCIDKPLPEAVVGLLEVALTILREMLPLFSANLSSFPDTGYKKRKP